MNKECIQLVKYYLKILLNRKFLVFVFACMLMPIGFNTTDVMCYEMFIPLCSVYISSKFFLVEEEFGVKKVFQMTAYNKGIIFMLKMGLNYFLYLILCVCYIPYINLLIYFDIVIKSMESPLRFVEVIVYAGGVNYLFLGGFTILLFNYLHRLFVCMGITLSYIIFWIGNTFVLSDMPLNLYIYSAECWYAWLYKLIYVVLTIIIIVINYKKERGYSFDE